MEVKKVGSLVLENKEGSVLLDGSFVINEQNFLVEFVAVCNNFLSLLPFPECL